MSRIIYSRQYNIGFYGLERLHPFDSRKYGRAWRVLRQYFGSGIKDLWIRPRRPVQQQDLLRVHTEDHLRRLRYAHYVSKALEIPVVQKAPSWMIDWHVLRPMRWATQGTILASRAALDCGMAVNLGGGYHHAKAEQGEGFCIYSDIAVAVATLRKEGALSQDARVAYIDTDAHQGNGVCHTFHDDRSVFIFDIFNHEIYPAYDVRARERIDCPIPITGVCNDEEYMNHLKGALPGFLDSVGRSPVGLAIYNAGTDVFAGDPLGGLNLSAQAILTRDRFVVSELRRRGIPTIMLLSGGYTKESYQLVADSVRHLIEDEYQLLEEKA